jgi:hypothetical protein
MPYEPDSKPLPKQLQKARGQLGDASIPHSLRYSSMGYPYIRFAAPAFEGEVSVQYRGMKKDRQTKEITREAHFLIFDPGRNGQQATRSCEPDSSSLMDMLGIDPDLIADGYARRDHLEDWERAVSVVDPQQEASLVASMRR